MHWKKDLTIETKFFQDGLENIPDAILVHPQPPGLHIKTGLSQDFDACARSSVEIIERVLSNKLIAHFIGCWEILKQNTLDPNVYRSYHRTSNSSLLSDGRNLGTLRHQGERTVFISDQLNSSRVDYLDIRRWGGGEQMAERHVERARLLKEIVQKLKRGKVQFQKTDQRVRRLNENQHLVSQIRKLEQVTNQIQHQRIIEHLNANRTTHHQVTQHHLVINSEQERLQQQMWTELKLLRQQLNGLRLQNQLIANVQHSSEGDMMGWMSKEGLETRNAQLTLEKEQLAYQKRQGQQLGVGNEFRAGYEKEMAILQQRMKNMQQREDMLRQQLMREMTLRQQMLIRDQQKQKTLIRQFLSVQNQRQESLRQQAQRQAQLRESLLKQQMVKQHFLREHALREQELRMQIQREHALKDQAQRDSNQQEIQLRTNNIQQFSQLERQLRKQLIEEYQGREESIKRQSDKLKNMQQQLLHQQQTQYEVNKQERFKMEQEIIQLQLARGSISSDIPSLPRSLPKNKLKIQQNNLQFSNRRSNQIQAVVVDNHVNQKAESQDRQSSKLRSQSLPLSSEAQRLPNKQLRLLEQHLNASGSGEGQSETKTQLEQKLRKQYQVKYHEQLKLIQVQVKSPPNLSPNAPKQGQSEQKNKLPKNHLLKKAIPPEIIPVAQSHLLAHMMEVNRQPPSSSLPNRNKSQSNSKSISQSQPIMGQGNQKQAAVTPRSISNMKRSQIFSSEHSQLPSNHNISHLAEHLDHHLQTFIRNPAHQHPPQEQGKKIVSIKQSQSQSQSQRQSQFQMQSSAQKQQFAQNKLETLPQLRYQESIMSGRSSGSPTYLPIQSSLKREHTKISFTQKNTAQMEATTERTKIMGQMTPTPEEQHYSRYGYQTRSGYGYETTRTTKTVRGPRITWNQEESRNIDSRAEWHLTGRPRQEPKYGSSTLTQTFRWPSRQQPNKEENICDCCF